MSDIRISVTFRHIEPTEALKHYAEQKIKRIGKLFSQPLDARVILAVESKEHQQAEVELHIGGTTLHGKGESEDLYAAIDLLIDKIERRVKKLKEKNTIERRRSSL